jgi:hypothetical protein
MDLGTERRRRDGAPIWIDKQTGSIALPRAQLHSSRDGNQYDEAWLQRLLHEHPEVFPAQQIEKGFGRVIPVCRELPLTLTTGRSGALDNFFVTDNGQLLIIEAKLWRNPEARRSAVAQAMEYAAAIFKLNYEELQSAVREARSSEPNPHFSLYEIARSHVADIDEVDFIESVASNLKRGRAIIAVVGDGIREDIIPMAELLQSHAGHRFTFALVELAIYDVPGERNRIAVPSVLAQTVMIERGVVQIEDRTNSNQRIVVSPPKLSVETDDQWALVWYIRRRIL